MTRHEGGECGKGPYHAPPCEPPEAQDEVLRLRAENGNLRERLDAGRGWPTRWRAACAERDEALTLRDRAISDQMAFARELNDLRNDYAALVEHHRQSEMLGTELAEAAKESIIYTGDGPSRDRVDCALMAWDAHQWPEDSQEAQ